MVSLVHNPLHDAVKEIALTLPNGCTDSKSHCPDCGSNKAFSVTREGNVLKFICFRASCGFKGIIDSTTGDFVGEYVSTANTIKLFNGELDFLNEDEIAYLAGLFNIAPALLQKIRWGLWDKRVYFPQYLSDGRVMGYIARYYPDLNGGIPLKGAKAYWKPCLGFPPPLLFTDLDILLEVRKQRQVVLVEDYPSALRIISQLGLPCCCLGGTNLYMAVIDSLIELGVDKVIVVLDADAIHKSLKMKQALCLMFDTVIIPLTGKDPKDMTLQELAKVFRGVTIRKADE